MKSARNRTKNEIEEDIVRLQDWLSKQPHLPKEIDKEFLAAYVHGTKSLEIAKKKLDAFFTFRRKEPEFFGFPARDPLDPAFKEASEALKQFILPQKTKEGYVVMMVCNSGDLSKFEPAQCLVRMMMMFELSMLRWPDMVGGVLLVDCGSVDPTILSKFTIGPIVIGLQWFQNAVPFRHKLGVGVNTPTFLELLLNTVVKPFISKKLFGRIAVTCEGSSAFKNFIDEDLLPCDYGGKAKSSTDLNNYWMQELIKNRDWFLKTSQLRVDESKRHPDEQDSFGIQGTFRSLAID